MCFISQTHGISPVSYNKNSKCQHHKSSQKVVREKIKQNWCQKESKTFNDDVYMNDR